MTKNQRNMLELALVHYRVDRISQGDSRGEVDPLKEMDSDKMFDQISEDVDRISDLDDEGLLTHAKMLANLDPTDDTIELSTIPSFQSFADLRKYCREHVDDGDLQVQTVLDVLVRQIIAEPAPEGQLTVARLIAELQKYPGNLPAFVMVESSSDWPIVRVIGYINGVSVEFQKESK